MPREQSQTLTEIFAAYKRRDTLDLYFNNEDDEVIRLSRGAVSRVIGGNTIVYDNYIRSVDDLRSSIDSAIDRITLNCQNVNSLLGFNLASNLRLLDYAIADYGKVYQSLRNPALVEDIPQVFRGVLANAEASEQSISFEFIVDYESLGQILASRSLSPRSWWTHKNGIECTSVSNLGECPRSREGCRLRGVEHEFGGWEFFEEPVSALPGSGGNDGGGIGIGEECFTGETLVWTPDGDIPIAELRSRLQSGKNSVYSFDPFSGEIIEDRIVEVFEHQTGGFFTFEFQHAVVNVTPEHRFLVNFGLFRAADKLNRNDTVKIVPNKKWQKSKLVKLRWNSDVKKTVWNIHVRRNQTYFANRCGVHNRKQPTELP